MWSDHDFKAVSLLWMQHPHNLQFLMLESKYSSIIHNHIRREFKTKTLLLEQIQILGHVPVLVIPQSQRDKKVLRNCNWRIGAKNAWFDSTPKNIKALKCIETTKATRKQKRTPWQALPSTARACSLRTKPVIQFHYILSPPFYFEILFWQLEPRAFCDNALCLPKNTTLDLFPFGY